jgi:hypothetical protein
MKIFLISSLMVGSFFTINFKKNFRFLPPQAESHKIGEHFGGGVVFYVDKTGEHGLIAATTDQKKAKWYNGNYIVTNAKGDAVGTGQANTTAIVTSQGVGTYAASECDQLELNGFSDWFLPSKGELNLLRIQKAAVGGLDNPFYWTSTEYSSHYAWAQNFSNGRQDYGNKNSTPSIRAIRAF